MKEERRSRSPFRIKEFERRHSKSMKILDSTFEKVDGLPEWKEQLKIEIAQLFTAKLESKDEEINELIRANRTKEMELERLKNRVAILEHKLKNDSSKKPALDDIEGLLAYLNLNKNSTLNDIRSVIKHRIYETDPESPIESQVTHNMTIQDREDMTIYLNQVQCALVEWKKDQNMSS